jgi:hypothetical protein
MQGPCRDYLVAGATLAQCLGLGRLKPKPSSSSLRAPSSAAKCLSSIPVPAFPAVPLPSSSHPPALTCILSAEQMSEPAADPPLAPAIEIVRFRVEKD